MQIADHRLGAVVEHMGIDLRRRNIGVAEQILDDAQVRAVLQQMAGEGVAQHVRADARRGDASGGRDKLEIAGERLSGKMAARALGGEQPRARS